MITTQLMLSLLFILMAAWGIGSLFARYGLPFVLGELLAGVIIGPPLLGLIGPSPSIELLAELGIFFVMFHTGMEMDPKELLEHLWPSLAVAAGGFILPFALGYFTTMAIAVQSVILHTLQINKTYIGHIIIGAAIADDILSFIGLSILLGLAKSGSVQIGDLAMLLAKVLGFFGFTILIGQFIMPRLTRKLHDREGKAFTFAMASALVMAYLAELVGLHLIIGAFMAGQFVRKEVMDEKIYHAISDRFYGLSYGFLVPIFFASLSFHLHINWNVSFLFFALVLTLVAILGKLVGCGLGYAAFRRNFWESIIVGFGMNGRGAVEIVVASVVLKLSAELMSAGGSTGPLLTQDQFSALILMAFITTLMAPLTLKWAVMKACSSEDGAAFCVMWDDTRDS
jgi:Kef-type K+ transport system membrane component KefB